MVELTNEECANILQHMFDYNAIMCAARGNGKSLTLLYRAEALNRAIELLRKTPDEEVK